MAHSITKTTVINEQDKVFCCSVLCVYILTPLEPPRMPHPMGAPMQPPFPMDMPPVPPMMAPMEMMDMIMYQQNMMAMMMQMQQPGRGRGRYASHVSMRHC